MARSLTSSGRRSPAVGRLTRDQSVVALLIGAMTANGHVSPQEAARAHHLVWSMKMFRRKSGQTVGRLIENSRDLIEQHGVLPVIAAARRAIPARLRPAVFAVAADLVLADGTIDRGERDFLGNLRQELRIDAAVAASLVKALLIKNSA